MRFSRMYSVMEIESGKILHTETVDKREVDLQSPNMERKAFKQSMEFLLSNIKCTRSSQTLHLPSEKI